MGWREVSETASCIWGTESTITVYLSARTRIHIAVESVVAQAIKVNQTLSVTETLHPNPDLERKHFAHDILSLLARHFSLADMIALTEAFGQECIQQAKDNRGNPEQLEHVYDLLEQLEALATSSQTSE